MVNLNLYSHCSRRFKKDKVKIFFMTKSKVIEVSISHDGKTEEFALPFRQSYEELMVGDIVSKLKRKESRPEKPMVKSVYRVPTAYEYLKDLLILMEKQPKMVEFETLHCATGTSKRVRLAKSARLKDIPWCTSDDGKYMAKVINVHVRN